MTPSDDGPTPRPALRMALAGDTMLGSRVGEALLGGERPLLDEGVLAAAREADLFLVNLECCISERGARWPDPRKPFFFRAPPQAADALAGWGVHGVTLANNHVLDFGAEALLDTIEHLDRVGIRHAGAGVDVASARAPALLEVRGQRVALVSVTDWPPEYAARDGRAGVAFADLRGGHVEWLPQALDGAAAGADVVVLSPHWGSNWTYGPSARSRAAAAELAPRATLVWGHSAHVPHGVGANVLYDSGDFLTDFHAPRRDSRAVRFVRRGRKELGELVGAALEGARREGASGARRAVAQQVQGVQRLLRQKRLRGDLQLLFLVTLQDRWPRRIEALPLKLTATQTRLAGVEESLPLRRRFRAACEALGTRVAEDGARLVLEPHSPA